MVDPKTGKPMIQKGESEQLIEHAFMFLSNLTAIEEGQKHILGIEGEYKYIVTESIFGMFCYFSKNKSFDFVSNIISNLACLEEGRKYMIEHKYIEAIVIQIVAKDLNSHRKQFLLSCLRNLFFEYQEFEEKFLEMNVPRDICKVIIDEQGLVAADLPDTWKQYGAKVPKSMEEISMPNCASMVDSLVLLGNSDKLILRMHEIDIDSLLPLIKFAEGPEYEDVKLRLEVMQN
mmetsp:Transcript_42332/g.64943  ORF Transcript_42332/g.64943 Transcript_42332/m.64943 type:complete len:232 (+) Transcript_42332:436-1131(+)